jgi:hypothetical protein
MDNLSVLATVSSSKAIHLKKWEVELDCQYTIPLPRMMGLQHVVVEFFTQDRVMAGKKAAAPHGVDACGWASDDEDFTRADTMKHIIVNIDGGN